MPRIPYIPKDLAEPRDIVEAIRARRGGSLMHLDRILLYSPQLAGAWNSFMRVVRTQLDASAKLRELAICEVALLNDAHYEYHHHAPLFLKAGGTQAQLDALKAGGDQAPSATLFDPTERAVIALTQEMTRNVQVRDSTMQAVREALGNDQHVVEIAATIGVYNLVSRFLVAFDIKPE